MVFKIIFFAGMVMVARTAVVPAIAPLAYTQGAPIVQAGPPILKTDVADDYDPNPQYSFAYEIQDRLTGDSKSQSETRNGDVVQGSYSVVDPDGIKRIVEYTADPHNGFNAVVHREQPTVAVKAVGTASVAKIATPVLAAPVTKIATPGQYLAPAQAYYHQ